MFSSGSFVCHLYAHSVYLCTQDRPWYIGTVCSTLGITLFLADGDSLRTFDSLLVPSFV